MTVKSGDELITADVIDFEALEHSTITLNITVTESDTTEQLSASFPIVINVWDANDLTISNVTTTSSGKTVLNTDGTDTIAITGTNFGPSYSTSDTPTVTVTYEDEYDGVIYTATSCAVHRANTQIRCTAAAGVGKGHYWTVSVEFRGVTWSVDSKSASISTDYMAPELNSVTGARNMPTSGDTTVTLTGNNFGPLYNAW